MRKHSQTGAATSHRHTLTTTRSIQTEKELSFVLTTHSSAEGRIWRKSNNLPAAAAATAPACSTIFDSNAHRNKAKTLDDCLNVWFFFFILCCCSSSLLPATHTLHTLIHRCASFLSPICQVWVCCVLLMLRGTILHGREDESTVREWQCAMRMWVVSYARARVRWNTNIVAPGLPPSYTLGAIPSHRRSYKINCSVSALRHFSLELECEQW